MHRGAFHNVSGLYPLDAGSTSAPVSRLSNVPRGGDVEWCKMVPH